MEQQNTQSSDPKHLHIVENKELSIGEANPVIALVLMLFYNVFYLAMMPLVEAINLFCF